MKQAPDLNDLLRSKAALLLRREREVAERRRAHERTEAWFRLFHAVSVEAQAGRSGSISERWASQLIGELGFQVAAIFRHQAGTRQLSLRHGLSPTPMRPDPAIDEDALVALLGQRAGICDHADDREPLGRLAASLGLGTFLWHLAGQEESRQLLVAGFLPSAARYQGTLTAEDLRSFTLVARHLQALFENAQLIGELQQRNGQYQAQSRELLRANEELAANLRERALTQAKLMAADRMASIGTLAGGMAHEINNPLAFITSNLAFLAQRLSQAGDVKPEEWRDLREVVEEAQQGAERVRRVVRDLRVFARADDLLREPVDLAAVLETAINLSFNEIRHRARLVKLYQPVPRVIGNEHRLGQLFVNLLVNAAQSISEGHEEHNQIRIVTAVRGDRVCVEVQDTGAGIPDHVRRRIFEPFVNTTMVGVGTGLGLSICHGIVKGFGGEIECESAPGEGSVFRVLLPAAPQDPAALVVPNARPQGPRGRRRILIVDDDSLVAKGLRRSLGAAHEVTLAFSGEEALALLRAAGPSYDVIFCDLMMPNLSGMDVFEEVVRTAPQLAGRFVFLPGGAFSERGEQFLRRTTNPVLDKPVDRDLLSALLERLP